MTRAVRHGWTSVLLATAVVAELSSWATAQAPEPPPVAEEQPPTPTEPGSLSEEDGQAPAVPVGAENLLARIAEHVVGQAQYYLGRSYYEGSGAAKDAAEAVKWFRAAAERGNRDGQRYLGHCYKDGFGVAANKTEAVNWFRRAANQGDAKAQYWLGLSYYEGNGVAKDPAEAVKWFRAAAEHGNRDGQRYLGYCYKDGFGVAANKTEAVNWFRRAANQGDAKAQGWLGFSYYEGSGVAKDSAEAVKWFRAAADQEDADAQRNLARCYAKGIGVQKNEEMAAKWLRRAADKGDAKASNELSRLTAQTTAPSVPKSTSSPTNWPNKTRRYRLARIEIPKESVHRKKDGVIIDGLPSLYITVLQNGKQIGERSEAKKGWDATYNSEDPQTWEISGSISESYSIELWNSTWGRDERIVSIPNLSARDFAQPIVEKVWGEQKGVVVTFIEDP